MFLKNKAVYALIMFFAFSVPAYSQWTANWIWQSDDGPANTWMCFRKTVSLSSAPATAYARVAADSKYWLWINGQLVVFEGQLKRNANTNDTYYDSLNLAPYLKAGANTIAAQVWYWGKDGFGHHSSGKGAFLFDGDFGGTAVRSDDTWKLQVHPAYENSTTGGQPNFRLSEYNVRFNAQNDGINGWQQPGYDDANWQAATVKGVPPTTPWNNLIKRPFSQFKNSGLMNYTNAATLPTTAPGGVIDARLPHDAHVSVYLRISTPTAGQVINIQTDMYDSMFLFGQGPCLRSEYVTKAGVQEFETFMWMSGNTVKYTIPAGVTILALQYREIGYPAEFSGQFSTNDGFYTTLWQKASRTLYVSMHDDFMDCPDRERGLWWGDVTNQLGEVFYALDTNAHALIRKDIAVLTGWQRTDNTLFSPPSTVWTQELPQQMLAAVGWYGFWNYFWNTNDSATIRSAYPAVKKYLGVWSVGGDGLVTHRDGGWNWGDWGNNIDMNVLDNCWYYLALKAAIPMAAMSGSANDTAAYRARMNSLASNFISSYWNTNGQYFMSSSVTTPDDRANAMAVLAGLAQPQHFAGIRTVLAQQTFASPYMEKYVLEALCKMNSDSLALARMKNRYTPMVNANYTTLWEVWNGLSEGTINHGWNAPNTVLSQYIAGVSPTAPGWSSYSVMPQMSQPTAISAVVPSIKGNIAVSDSLSSSQFIMNLSSPSGTKAMVGIPKKRAWQLVTVNGQAVWSQGKFCSGVAGVSEAGEDNLYIKFNVDPGASRFVASLVTIPAHRDTVFNGAFGLGTLGWTFNVWGGGAHGSVANGEYKIQIDSIAQNNSAIQLVQNGIILQQGKSYEVKFDAYASANRTLEANMEQDVNPWTSYLPALQNFNLTTTKTTYSYTFTMTNPTDSNGRVTFNAGASTKSVFIDNVSVKAISASIHSNNDLKESSVAWLSHSQLRVKFRAPQGSAISLGIFDLNGALVRSGAFRAGSGESQSWTTDLSGMPRGLYFVRVDADGNDILRSKFLYDN